MGYDCNELQGQTSFGHGSQTDTLGVANRDSSTTIQRLGCIGTTPDVTFVSEGFSASLTGWKVFEKFGGSDH